MLRTENDGISDEAILESIFGDAKDDEEEEEEEEQEEERPGGEEPEADVSGLQSVSSVGAGLTSSFATPAVIRHDHSWLIITFKAKLST